LKHIEMFGNVEMEDAFLPLLRQLIWWRGELLSFNISSSHLLTAFLYEGLWVFGYGLFFLSIISSGSMPFRACLKSPFSLLLYIFQLPWYVPYVLDQSVVAERKPLLQDPMPYSCGLFCQARWPWTSWCLGKRFLFFWLQFCFPLLSAEPRLEFLYNVFGCILQALSIQNLRDSILSFRVPKRTRGKYRQQHFLIMKPRISPNISSAHSPDNATTENFFTSRQKRNRDESISAIPGRSRAFTASIRASTSCGVSNFT